MALRSTRLQHAIHLPHHIKHQLALETLQLWSPLSYQMGLASQTPELEIHRFTSDLKVSLPLVILIYMSIFLSSYVLLFPRSFGSFLGWYGSFKSIASGILKLYRNDLETRLRKDHLMPVVTKKVTIQSRLKTPSSAFKKMVKVSICIHYCKVTAFNNQRISIECEKETRNA